jgi:hypothetical protein
VTDTLAWQAFHDHDHSTVQHDDLQVARIGAFHPHSPRLCVVGPIRSSPAQLSRAEDLEEVVKVLVAIAGIVGAAILRGLALAVMWSWFIAGPEGPFKGVPQLSIVNAIGLSMVVSFLTNHANTSMQKQSSHETKGFGQFLVEGLATEIFYIGIIWIMALIVHAMQS